MVPTYGLDVAMVVQFVLVGFDAKRSSLALVQEIRTVPGETNLTSVIAGGGRLTGMYDTPCRL